jgi:probable phosphoglycerate mutase
VSDPNDPARAPGSIVPDGLDATLVLLRHGESEWVARGLFQGQGNPPLSALGRRQAELAADRLAHAARPPALPVPPGVPVAVLHSPLARAAETAAVLAETMGRPAAFDRRIPLEVAPGLAEIGQGEWEGLPGAEIAKRWADLLAGWRRDPLTSWAPGGETLEEVDARVRVTLAALLGRLADARAPGSGPRSHVLGYADLVGEDPWAILVAHDGSFKIALLALLDLPLARFWSFPFALCGITVVELRGGRARLRLHNATDHLAPLEAESATQLETERSKTGAL